MAFDLLQPLPYFTSDLPGLGGRIKAEPEDFEVEEIPAYEPSGTGDFLYLWIEKRDLGAEYFARQAAQRLGVRPDEIGMAGLKDRRAVTRQWISVPAVAQPRLAQLEGDGIRVLRVSRHANKLRPGHLHGNRFRVRIRDVAPALPGMEHVVLMQIIYHGLPNFYGEQRFGRDGETLRLGLKLLGERPPLTPPSPPRGRGQGEGGARKIKKFLRKLALSAAQSALFNAYLAQRMQDGLLQQVLPGDVMAKRPAGGLFRVEDPAAEQLRFDAREIVPAGPIFGRKLFPSAGVAAEREANVLRDAGLTPDSFHGFGKLLQGTRRHNLVYLEDLHGELEGNDVLLAFSLPAGSYATVLLREIMKTDRRELEQL